MQQQSKELNFKVGQRYEIKKPLGQGAYGIVVSALDKKNQKLVAIKKLPFLEDIIDAKRILREIRILRYFQHENILELQNIIYDDSSDDQVFGDIYLVTNYMEIDLYKVIKSRQKLTDDHIQYIVYQIIRGLYYLHSANVIHRDIKPSNILANENCDVKMCDFGLSRNIEDEDDSKDQPNNITEYVVTRFYRAPEVMLSSHEYGKPVDIWSVGCTFAELITGQILFPGQNYIKQIKLIIDFLGKPSEDKLKFITNTNAKKYIDSIKSKPQTSVKTQIKYENELALDLLDKMLEIDPNSRITAEEALKHKYFESFHDPDDEPSFKGTLDFKFENDQFITIDQLRKMILEEILIYNQKNTETLIDIEKSMKKIQQKQELQKKMKNLQI